MTNSNSKSNSLYSNHLNKFIIYSLIIHTFLVFGLSIKWYTQRSYSNRTIDVTLIASQTKNKPKIPEYLAQAHNIGGGNDDVKHVPTNTNKALFPDEQLKEVVLAEEKVYLDEKPNLVNQKNNAVVTKATTDLNSANNATINNSERQLSQESLPKVAMIEQQNQVAQLTSLVSKIDNRANLLAKRPKKRFISASTEEYRDAEYLIKWREKIEYYGNKYYPEQARARNLAGEVLLLVSLKANGELEKVSIERSSGIKILDEAAIQTVHIAAPFDPFPANMRKDTDILEIVRTWRFNNEDGLTTN